MNWAEEAQGASAVAVAVFSAILVVVGILQVCVYRRQARIMENQASIVQNQFELTQRARVYIEDVVLTPDGGSELKFSLRNSGSLPATQVGFDVVRIDDQKEVNPGVGPRYQSYLPGVRGDVIPPGTKIPAQRKMTDRAASLAQVQAVKDGKAVLQIGIVVAYRDGFDKEGITWQWFSFAPEYEGFISRYTRHD